MFDTEQEKERYKIYKIIGVFSAFGASIAGLTALVYLARLSRELIQGITLLQIIILLFGMFLMKTAKEDFDKFVGGLISGAVIVSIIGGWFDFVYEKLAIINIFGVNGLSLALIIVVIFIAFVIDLIFISKRSNNDF